MKYTLNNLSRIAISLVITLVIVSCAEQESTPEVTVTPVPEPINPPVVVEEIEVPKQKNVVTPEYWEAFDTDIRVIYYYSKIDSLQQNHIKQKLVAATFAEKQDFMYHEYYTNDNMGMVQLNDTKFFNLSEYLMSNNEGFLLLKKGAIKNIATEDVSEVSFEKELEVFFE